MSDRYSDEIERAKTGDVEAFGRVVREFQDMAFASALGWLKDSEAAKDVTQDAFLEAFEHLDQLRTPDAFPGWFKRIVIKHCDRATRRKRLSLDTVAELQEDPLDTLRDQENRKHIRALVEALPPNQRIIVVLQYFAELKGAEIAELMDLPLSTVKKRLRSARARLREIGEASMIEKKITAPESLSDEVMFFVALRTKNHDGVRHLLGKQASLADATQSWDSKLAEEKILPFPNHATALIVCVELNDLRMLNILLDAGADPDGLCGCKTAETPLWATSLFNRPPHAEALLKAGANPNLASSAGNYPLHLAAMRGHEEQVSVLLKYGADPELLDAGPKWPEAVAEDRRDAAAWAQANGHKGAARLLRAASKGAQSTGAQAVDRTTINNGIVHTGIKSIDLFAPIPHGELTRVVYEPNSGVVTLVGEVVRRWVDAKLGRVVWTGFVHEPIDKHDWEGDLDELGLRKLVEFRMGSLADDEEVRIHTFDEALDVADKEVDETLLVVVSNPGFEHHVESSYARIVSNKRITGLIVTPDSNGGRASRPFSAQIKLDQLRVKRLLLPPVDPDLSYSESIKKLDLTRRLMTEEARALVKQYVSADPDLERVFADGDIQNEKARKLISYLRQPFFTTEPFTGAEGEFVSTAELIENVTAIV